MNEKILREAEFDPRLKGYIFMTGLLILLATFIGVVLIPIWALGLGQWYARAYCSRLKCVLTEGALIVRKGVFFRAEKTIPLDKIQDLGLRHGPLMRAYGIIALKVETAGQSVAAGASEANLPGVVDAREFRDAVREQRDARAPVGAGAIAPAGAPRAALSESALLTEIRDSLQRIEGLLKR